MTTREAANKDLSLDIKFGTDGWRGVMARDFTFENVRRVSQAIAEYIKNLPPKARGLGKVIVGYDRRFQSDAFANEVARVMQGNGLKPVLLEETLPTPAVSWLTSKEKAFGIMVTASHNPAAFNGIKIKLDGRAATDEVTKSVESYIDKSPAARNGPVEKKSYRKPYLEWLKSRVATGPISNLKRPVVVDYLYGAATGLMEELIKNKKLITIHSAVDPLFGGLNPEPIEKNLGELIAKVKEEKALIGIALDGDADRIGIIDDQGHYLSPCQVFPIITEYLITTKGIKGKVVQSVSMGYLAGRIAKAHNLPFEELPVGFKHVGEQIAKGQAVIGGEESGGYAWKGAQPERDGLMTALLMLEICHKLKKTPSQLLADIEKKYGKSCFTRIDFHLNKAVPDKHVWVEKIKKRLPKKVLDTEIKQLLDIDGLKVILADDNWVLMRPSGTEPLLRTYAESESPKKTQALLELAKKWAHA
ncbi:MAG: phosphoglucomutase/phosphomannomutase family protein [Elusimicrobia bacterium]|nr:phosphoglucomutase/phosphomannomutase family protein [Elusimicrobiota bacterium]